MGSICSKGAAEEDVNTNKNERQVEVDKFSVQLVAPAISNKEEILVDVLGRKDVRRVLNGNVGNVIVSVEKREKKTKVDDDKKKKGHHRSVAMDLKSIDDQPRPGAEREAWPKWLEAAAGEAVKGWLPRRADSFEKLDKIGQGTYSTVFKARDLETGKIVAMKKVRFVNMDPKSERFMAREIVILRRVDHQNVMKLEGIATSRMSGSLYLVFEYMEHDLAGLAANPSIKYTEAQIKCYMQQLLRGLEHCHKRGILHRDIKGSNLLINNDGVLKIADFGLATFYQPDQNLPLTSRVEQMHKIFKLCGSPSDAYWTKTKFPHATSFKPQQPYIRRIAETFKNFPPSALTLVDRLLSMEPQDRGTEPLPSDPSSLPRYPPSKELDAKIRDQEARRQKAEAESVRRGAGDTMKAPTSEFTAQGQPRTAGRSYKYNIQEDGGPSFRTEPPKKNGVEHSASVIHPSAAGLSLSKSVDCIRNNPELRSRKTHMSRSGEVSSSSLKKKERVPT
ncbi:hypothetical protein DKX38_029531 [Salix brachista]|uniref:Protein kinase domain-containing protein n=1 Tax=Salix brachista TaxID=2182728 RepID=A0A5N5J566_9ROSI|nr:hypothetical protein DKX38_029531 [Salix brachista]